MYIYLQRIFSFCETAESNNKIHVSDTTEVRGCGMYEKLVNLYKMKSIAMFRNFIAKKGGCYDRKTSLDLSQKYRVDENGCNASLLILPVSPFSLYFVVISLKTDNGFSFMTSQILSILIDFYPDLCTIFSIIFPIRRPLEREKILRNGKRQCS